MQKFENMDILACLDAVMKQNTGFYQSDFEIDKEIIHKAAASPDREDRTLLWLSRPSGTHCFRERDVFLKDTRPYNTWKFHGEQTRDRILAYAVELTGRERGKIRGNLYELDYAAHFRHVREQALPADIVTLFYERGERSQPTNRYLMSRLICNIFRHWYCDLSRNTKSTSLQGAYSFKHKGIVGALVARERHRYFSIPVYVINTASGYMMATVFVVFAVAIKGDVASQIDQFGKLFQVPSASVEVLYTYVLTILLSLSCTTFPSISMEGKNMELVKSMPITAFEFIKAKILFHLSLSIPITLVLNTALAFGLHLQWTAILSGYLLPLVFSAFIGVAGCIANLLFPNFDWENATYIVKRSIPAILNALISMALSCGGFYILIKHFPKHLFIGNAVIILIVVGLTAAAILWLKEKG